MRTIIAVANHKNITLNQKGVKIAFLNEKLEEELNMKVPEGVIAQK